MQYLKTIQSLRPICLFVAVVKHKSIARASKQLDLPSARFSEAIKYLETLWKAELFVRRNNRLIPTERGIEVYDRYSYLVDSLMQSIAEDTDRSNKPTLRIAAPVEFASEYLPTVISSLSNQFPDIRLTVLASDAVVDMSSQSVDLAIRIGPGFNPLASNAVKIRNVNELLVGAPKIVDAITSAKAKKAVYIAFSPIRISEHISLKNGQCVELDRSIECDNSIVFKNLLLKGAGIGIMLDMFALPYLKKKKLAEIQLADAFVPSSLYITWPNATLGKPAANFLLLIKEVFG